MTKFVVKIFFLLQATLIACFFLGLLILPEKSGYLGKGLGELTNNPLVYSRANFDGFHYTKIARDGYGYLQQAFFPFYPQLIKFLFPFFKSYIIAGLLISNLSFLLALVFLAKLLSLEGVKPTIIKKTILFLCFFPASFYFLSVYTESLFLLLAVLSFYFARQKKWLWAGLVAGLASYTRVVGIFVFPALVLEYCRQADRLSVKAFLNKNFLFVFLSTWGLLAYSLMLKATTGDPLYFAHVQPQFGAQRSVGGFILLYQVFWRYLKMVVTVSPDNLIYFNVWLELATAILFLGLLLAGITKFKIPLSYLVFFLLAYILPTLTGTFLSLPRLVLVIFPAFWLMGSIAEKFPRLGKTSLLLSFILLVICTTLFFRGFWLA